MKVRLVAMALFLRLFLVRSRRYLGVVSAAPSTFGQTIALTLRTCQPLAPPEPHEKPIGRNREHRIVHVAMGDRSQDARDGRGLPDDDEIKAAETLATPGHTYPCGAR